MPSFEVDVQIMDEALLAVGAEQLAAVQAEQTSAADTVASPVGAAAMSAEVQSSLGDDTMREIREALHIGTIKFGQLNPVIAQRHAADRTQLRDTARDWLSDHPSKGLRVEEIAKRFANTWLLYALHSSDPQTTLNDESHATATLASYVGDVNRARALGLESSAEANALYNSVAVLEQCFARKAESRHLTDAAIRRCAENRPRDVTGAVDNYLLKARTLEERFGDQLDDATLRHFAARQGVSTCVARVQKYFDDCDALAAAYEDNPLVTPFAIRSICKDTEYPDTVIEARLAAAQTLISKYKGQEGLTESAIFSVVADHAKPESQIKLYLRTIEPARAALGSRLPDETIRWLCLRNRKPLEVGAEMIRRIDELAPAFAQDPNVTPSDILYFVRNNGDATVAELQGMLAGFSGKQNIAARHFAGDPRVTRELIQRLSLQSGDIITVVDSRLEVLEVLRAQHADAYIPAWVFNVALFRANPDGFIGQYLTNVSQVTQAHGKRLSPYAIEVLCGRLTDPLDHIKARVDQLQRTQERYGDRGLATAARVEWAVMLSGDIRQGLERALGDAILADIHELHNTYPQLGMWPPRPYIRPLYDRLQGEAQTWVVGVGVAPPDREVVAKLFTQMWFGYSRHRHPDVLNDFDVAHGVFNKYYDGVLALSSLGLPIGQACRLAKSSNLDSILADIEGGFIAIPATRPVTEKSAARPSAGRLHGESREFKELGEPHTPPPNLDEAKAQLAGPYGNNRNLTDAVIKRALGYKDWRAAIDRYVENLPTLKSTFKGRPGVTPRVIRHFAMNLNPGVSIRNYLVKYDWLAERFGHDGDFSDGVFQELALTYSPARLEQEALDWKERYAAICRAALDEGGEFVPEAEPLRMAIVRHKTGDLDKRLAFAHYLDRVFHARDVRREAMVREKTHSNRGSKRRESGDLLSLPGDLTPEEALVQREDRKERLELASSILSLLTDVERHALLVYHGYQYDMTRAEISAGLGQDMDDYVVEVILPGLRQLVAEHYQASEPLEDD